MTTEENKKQNEGKQKVEIEIVERNEQEKLNWYGPVQRIGDREIATKSGNGNSCKEEKEEDQTPAERIM